MLARRTLLVSTAATLAACAARSPPNATACRPHKLAELVLRSERNFLLAPATVQGRPGTLLPGALLIDTGAETTTLTPEAVAALQLAADPGRTLTLAGVTGTVRSATVRVREIALGRTVIARARSVAVGDMPTLAAMTPPVLGLLGADVLAAYDLDLDLPAGRMALYAADGCADYRPWAGARPVPFERSRTGLAYVDAQVDGRPVRALIDTGARTSLLTREAALALGVSPGALATDTPRTGIGLGDASMLFRQHHFASLGLPGALDRDVTANVAPLRLPGADMLLGADYLGRRRVWISYATGRLFLR